MTSLDEHEGSFLRIYIVFIVNLGCYFHDILRFFKLFANVDN